jgi:hypothetical protein
LSSEFVADYLKAGSRAVVLVAGSPATHVIIDPPQHRVGLEVEWDGLELPDLAVYEHLRAEVAFHDDVNWSVLWLNDPRTLVDAYPMLCALADKVQIDKRPISSAIPEILASYERILEGAERLSAQEEIGLIGELLLLAHLVSVLGDRSALECWLGPDKSEHDFSVDTFDLEVKTTSAEVRRHWVSSHTQLVASQGRALMLVSIQLTIGVEGARTLGEAIRDLRGKLAPDALGDFDKRLDERGWRDAHEKHYRRRWRLRSSPAAFVVDEVFPAITTTRLLRAGLPVERYARLSYELDLSGLAVAQLLPRPLAGFLGTT